MRNIFLGIYYGLYMILQLIRVFIGNFIILIWGEKKGQTYIENNMLKWAKHTNKILGLKINVEGFSNIPDEACVFISNHQSILDIPILLQSANRPIGFIAKKELLKVPVIGYWMRKVHCVPINRSNAREALKVINEGVNNLANGHYMAIFPEGTRAKDGIMKEFKKGSLKLATKAKVKIIPVTIDGAYRAYELNNKFKKAEVTITFGKAIDTTNLSKEDEKELPKIVEGIVKKNIKK